MKSACAGIDDVKLKNMTPAAASFDQLPSESLVDVLTVAFVLGTSLPSVYRMFSSGKLTKIKLGTSTRIRVGELRQLMGSPRHEAHQCSRQAESSPQETPLNKG